MRAIHYILAAFGLATIGAVAYFGELKTAAAAVIGVIAVSVVAFDVLRSRVEETADARARSNMHANKEYFVRNVREIDLIHTQSLRDVARDLGRAEELAETLSNKIHRMTDRPRIGNRFAKKADVALAMAETSPLMLEDDGVSEGLGPIV